MRIANAAIILSAASHHSIFHIDRYWQDNPQASSIDSLYLEAETKGQIESLYNLLDTNGDGKISIEDFALPSGDIPRERQAQWELLRDEFDFDVCILPAPLSLPSPHTLK